MKLNQLQTLIVVCVLVAAATALYLTGHDAPASLCLGAAIGALTPTEPFRQNPTSV
jgi:hypothetical protein